MLEMLRSLAIKLSFNRGHSKAENIAVAKRIKLLSDKVKIQEYQIL